MRIALCGGIDASWVEMLSDEAHDVVCVCTDPTQTLGSTLFDLIKRHRSLIIIHPIAMKDIELFTYLKIDLIVSLGYPYKIPTGHSIPAINIHPSLLPDGRGSAPIPEILARHPESAGVTIHKIAAELDAGDILAQERFEVSEFDSAHTLLVRTYLRSSVLMRNVLSDFSHYWENALPQPRMGRWAVGRFQGGEIDTTLSVAANLACWRAYGPGCTIYPGSKGRRWVTGLDGWLDDHKLDCGRVVVEEEGRLIVAVVDGFLAASFAT